MLKKILYATKVAKTPEERAAKLQRDLMRHEARIGGQLFGPVPQGGRREFFCLDEHTWVWYEEWTDAKGSKQTRTTRYDVRPSGIVKAQDGRAYQPVSDQEALRIRDAVNVYERRVMAEIYEPIYNR